MAKKNKIKPTKSLITFQLTRSEIGQILEGLQVRQEQWINKAVSLKQDEYKEILLPEDGCIKAEEAEWIADFYKSIILKIEKQIEF